MLSSTVTALHARTAAALAPDDEHGSHDALDGRGRRVEKGFEIAQSMGIALLGLVVAAAFATALETLGVDVIDRIRTELGL